MNATSGTAASPPAVEPMPIQTPSTTPASASPSSMAPTAVASTSALRRAPKTLRAPNHAGTAAPATTIGAMIRRAIAVGVTIDATIESATATPNNATVSKTRVCSSSSVSVHSGSVVVSGNRGSI